MDPLRAPALPASDIMAGTAKPQATWASKDWLASSRIPVKTERKKLRSRQVLDRECAGGASKGGENEAIEEPLRR